MRAIVYYPESQMQSIMKCYQVDGGLARYKHWLEIVITLYSHKIKVV